jgi:hypothetical protein
MRSHRLDYDGLAAQFQHDEMRGKIMHEQLSGFDVFLFEDLPALWCDSYRRMPNGPVQIVEVIDQGYTFLFDLGASRVVAAYGNARHNPLKRDSARMAGFLGNTAGLSWRERFFATHYDRYDRGHFMSHRQGGGLDINLFPQRADINQGRTALGQQYRAMERHCASIAGTFCFSRPIYDRTWVPAALDYGAMYGPHLRAKRFPNK